MKQDIEIEMRKRLVVELKGLLHNLKYNTDEFRMTQEILQKIKRTDKGIIRIMCEYAEYFEAVGISVRDLFEDIV